MSGNGGGPQLSAWVEVRLREFSLEVEVAVPAGKCLALVGPLGAGKTQLAKGVAEGLGVTSVVNSPTFIIMNEHAGRLPLFHVDAYRLTDGDEGRQAGVFDVRRHLSGYSHGYTSSKCVNSRNSRYRRRSSSAVTVARR